MDQDRLGKLFLVLVVVASIGGTGLILGGTPLVTGIGVMLLIVGIISIIPALVLTWGTEG